MNLNLLENLLKGWRLLGWKGAKLAINLKIQEFGKITHLEIAPERKTLSVIMELEGEEAPLELAVSGYRLKETAEGLVLTITKIRSNREWISLVAQNFLVGKALLIPEEYSGVAWTVLA